MGRFRVRLAIIVAQKRSQFTLRIPNRNCSFVDTHGSIMRISSYIYPALDELLFRQAYRGTYDTKAIQETQHHLFLW